MQTLRFAQGDSCTVQGDSCPAIPRSAREGETRRGLILDETIPCTRLPIYTPASSIIPLTSVGRARQVTVMLNIYLDSAGTPTRGGIDVLAIDDTAVIRDFRRQAGLKFKRSSPDQALGRVRCALTIAWSQQRRQAWVSDSPAYAGGRPSGRAATHAHPDERDKTTPCSVMTMVSRYSPS